MVSHTTTGEWKSFEQRMRRRRAERLLLRADIAAEAGFSEDARAALAEAQRICPTLPGIAAVEQRIHTADTAQPPSAAAPRYPRHAYVSLAAALVILAIGGVWQASHVQRLPAHTLPAIVPAAPAPPATLAAVPHVGVVVEHVPIVAMIGTSGRASDPSTAARVDESRTSISTEPVAALVDRVVRSAPEATEAVEVPSPSVQPVSDLSVHTSTAPPVLNVGQPIAAAPSFSAVSDGGRAASAVRDETLVRRTLGRYAAAYSSLDADAAQAVWPGVNRGALARAFDDLASQQIALRECRVDVTGGRARAACAGSMTWRPKVGSGSPRTEPRNWEFELAKAGDDWQILTARIQNR